MSQQTATTTNIQDRSSEQQLRGDLVTFSFHLAKLNLNNKTIHNRAKSIEALFHAGADLTNTDSVLTALALHNEWSNGYKSQLLQAWKSYCHWKKLNISNVDLPRFRKDNAAPYVPTEAKVDALISASGWKLAAFIQLLKETGARTIEAARIKWLDIDTVSHNITIRNPAKGSNPRQIHVSEKCIQMLSRQPHDYEYVFGREPGNIRLRMKANFNWLRNRVSVKTADPDLKRIHLHTFRHFYATKLYLQTGDIRYVQKKLGHKSINSTVIYEHSEPNQEVETFIIKAAASREEAEKLMALGYEYHYKAPDGADLFRKKLTGI